MCCVLIDTSNTILHVRSDGLLLGGQVSDFCVVVGPYLQFAGDPPDTSRYQVRKGL